MRAHADHSPKTALRSETPRAPARSVAFDGVGIHAGVPARLTIHPADPGTGVVFHRTDLRRGERFIPARIANVLPGALATRLALPEAPDEGIGTVEHILAALAIVGVEDALLEVDGPEVPILDGSAARFVAGLDEAGFESPPASRWVIEILEPVRLEHGASFAQFEPYAGGLMLDIAIDFANPAIGRQRRAMVFEPNVFRREIAPARTFGFIVEAERLWRDGFARAASFDNTIVLDADKVLNPAGLRFADEFVRHKMLDALGDLTLAGAPIQGVYRTCRGGHALNRAAVAALLSRPEAWRMVNSRRRPVPNIAGLFAQV